MKPRKRSRSRVLSFPPADTLHGMCPACGRATGYVNLGREHWFYCSRHRAKWLGAVDVFPSWRQETQADWKRNEILLSQYVVVTPHIAFRTCEPDGTWIDPVPVQPSELATFDVQLGAGQTCSETWQPARLTSCPACSLSTVWVEHGPGDPYQGRQYLCVTCGARGHWQVDYADTDPLHQQRLAALRQHTESPLSKL